MTQRRIIWDSFNFSESMTAKLSEAGYEFMVWMGGDRGPAAVKRAKKMTSRGLAGKIIFSFQLLSRTAWNFESPFDFAEQVKSLADFGSEFCDYQMALDTEPAEGGPFAPLITDPLTESQFRRLSRIIRPYTPGELGYSLFDFVMPIRPTPNHLYHPALFGVLAPGATITEDTYYAGATPEVTKERVKAGKWGASIYGVAVTSKPTPKYQTPAVMLARWKHRSTLFIYPTTGGDLTVKFDDIGQHLLDCAQ